ncbi:MAG: NAD(P)-dependent oxidoreductase [Bacteroidales bacterium]|nr:NAD(P)-dependent oxidoreductase [Bacteroidales bacterium]
MKKILITGASGFIGSFLVNNALKLGFEVYAGIRESSNLRYLNDAGINFFKTNLADKKTIRQDLLACDKFDFIIHNAGVTKTCDKKMFEEVNYKYTKNLIEALYETNRMPEKFIFISSLAAYGPGNNKTLAPVKDDDVPKPVSLYGQSKLKAEQYIKSLENFPYLIFRPTGVYGAREKDYLVMYKSIKSGFETYIGSKNQYLTFIYIKDLVRVIFDALKSDITQKGYFLSDLNNYTAYEFNKIVKTELDKKTISLVFPKFLIKE